MRMRTHTPQAIKARAMDLVLFVKHGSFYNLFDVDADVGLRVGLQVCGVACG
jgi:DNA mismatch repair ATPase MutS